MLSANTKSEERPSEQFSRLAGKLIDASANLFKNNDVPDDLRIAFNKLISVKNAFSKALVEEEILRPEFKFDYSLLKKRKVLQFKLDNEKATYNKECKEHEQKKLDKENQLERIKGKLLQAKLDNIVDDLHDMVKAEKLHLLVDDRIEEISEQLAEAKACCSWWNSRTMIRESENILAVLKRKKDELLSNDPSILKKAVVEKLEEKQQEIEKELDEIAKNPPSKPSCKLSNEFDEITAKLEGGEEHHNSSLSRNSMYMLLQIYILFEKLLQRFSEPDAVNNPSLLSAFQSAPSKPKLKAIFSEYEDIIEKSAEKFWCPDSGNKKLKHFYKAFIKLSDEDEVRFIAAPGISEEFLNTLLPVVNHHPDTPNLAK